MAQVADLRQSVISVVRPTKIQWSWAWLGAVPFFIFAVAFLFLPAAKLFISGFQDAQGNFTFDNILGLFKNPYILGAYGLSIKISVVTALGGGLLGFMVAYAVTVGGAPRIVRSALVTFSGLAANFGGVPLAFAFIATIGRTGFISVFLKSVFGLDIYATGFNLYSFLGLSLTYLYFQFPLMILIMTPALDGLKAEWREASENLGATPLQYWCYIALPILWPSLLGTMILLFGSAFGAYATAQALTGGTLSLVTIIIGSQIRGDVLGDPSLGYAMALGMIVVMGICMLGYTYLQRRTARWIQ